MIVDGYLLKEIISKDSSGYEYYLTYKSNNKFLTKKIVRKKLEENKDEFQFIKNEILMLNDLSHRNIIKFKQIMKTKKFYYAIMEYCNGGTIKENLEKYINKYGKPFSEKMAQYIIRQLFDVMKYLDYKKITKYELFLEDILLNYYTEEAKNNTDIFHSDLKLTNFRKARHNEKEKLGISILIELGTVYKKDNKYKNIILNLFLFCYYLFTGDLSFKIIDEDDLMKKEIKLPINLSLEAISFLFKILKNYTDNIKDFKELSNYPFLKKYFGDFVDIDIKDISKFIKDEYLIFNINNINEIYKVIQTDDVDKI